MRAGLAVGSVALALLLSGCPFPVRLADSRDMSRDAVTGVVDAFGTPVRPGESVGEANRRRLRELVSDVDVVRAVHDIAEAATSGAMEGLTEDELWDRLRQHTDELVRAVASALGEEMAGIGPAAREAIDGAVHDAVARLTGPSTRRAVADMGAGLAGAATRAVFDEMGAGIDRSLAGPVERLIRGAIRGAIEEMQASEDVVADLAGVLARRAARGAADGIGEALHEGPLHDELARLTGRAEDELGEWRTVLAWVAGGLLAVAAVLGAYFWRRARRMEQALGLVTSHIKSAVDKEPSLVSLVREIKTSGRAKHPGGPPLREFLEANEAMRVKNVPPN